MERDPKLRKQVNSDQLVALVEFMRGHQDLAKGLVRGRRGKLNTLSLWNLCAKKLNVFKDGARKDGKGWSKYWCDWKYRVRKRALEEKAAKEGNAYIPENSTPLSQLEENILSIIGERALDSVVIKRDPLADTEIEEQQDYAIPDNPEPNNFESQSSEIRDRKRRCSSKSILENDCIQNREVYQTDDDSDPDTATEFLRLEKEKLESIKKTEGFVQTIATEITRLADIMSHIKDELINNNRINI
ncbi:unnamed protein product, partial [Brenthis ino]